MIQTLMKLFHFYSFQAIGDGWSKATQEMQSASTDKARAEAQVAVECYEALQTAME